MLYHVSEPDGSGSGVADSMLRHDKAGKGWPKKLGWYGCELIHNMGLGQVYIYVTIAPAFVLELTLEGYTVVRVESTRGGM